MNVHRVVVLNAHRIVIFFFEILHAMPWLLDVMTSDRAFSCLVYFTG